MESDWRNLLNWSCGYSVDRLWSCQQNSAIDGTTWSWCQCGLDTVSRIPISGWNLLSMNWSIWRRKVIYLSAGDIGQGEILSFLFLFSLEMAEALTDRYSVFFVYSDWSQAAFGIVVSLFISARILQPSVSDVTSARIVLFVQALAEKRQGASSSEREWIKGVIGCAEKIHRADINRNGRKIERDRIYLERTDLGSEGAREDLYIGLTASVHWKDIYVDGEKNERERIYLERTDLGSERRSIHRVNSERSLKGHIRRRRERIYVERKDLGREERFREVINRPRNK